MRSLIDWFVLLVAAALLLLWVYRLVYRWLHTAGGTPILLLDEGAELSDDDPGVRLLEQAGYQVKSGKHRIPVRIRVDDEHMQSRLFIDYVAERDGKLFLVKTLRERQPMEWTGSGIRDRLLVYKLLVPHSDGLLLLDHRTGVIRTVLFELDAT